MPLNWKNVRPVHAVMVFECFGVNTETIDT